MTALNKNEITTIWRHHGLLIDTPPDRQSELAQLLEHQINHNAAKDMPSSFKRLSIPLCVRVFCGLMEFPVSCDINLDVAQLAVTSIDVMEKTSGFDMEAEWVKTQSDLIVERIKHRIVKLPGVKYYLLGFSVLDAKIAIRYYIPDII